MRIILLLLGLSRIVSAAEPVDFDKSVAPLLASRCLECHSGADAKSKLDLSTAKGFKAGGQEGSAAVAGKPTESLLWQRINADEMPPKHPLPANERAVLKAWIEQGAKWGSDPIDPYRFSTATRAGRDWWSLHPLTRLALHHYELSPIDELIRAKLAEKKLQPSPMAERRTLIRRLTFDLTCLPPTPADVDTFIADESPEAYKSLVNRLLASPYYGERWARHWLDVAHFGESDGFEFDKIRPNSMVNPSAAARSRMSSSGRWACCGRTIGPSGNGAKAASGSPSCSRRLRKSSTNSLSFAPWSRNRRVTHPPRFRRTAASGSTGFPLSAPGSPTASEVRPMICPRSSSCLSKEEEKTKELYGLNRDETKDFGRSCLLARRLLEQGVRFVQLFSGGSFGAPRINWDGHEDMKENHDREAIRIDRPLAALLKDLRRRGMLEDTLVLFTSEFGRTPFTQSKADVVGKGRDHNQYGFSVWMAGVGLKHGTTYGATDSIGWKAAENKATWYDFHATVLKLLGIDHTKLTYYHNGIQRRLTNVHGDVISGILA